MATQAIWVREAPAANHDASFEIEDVTSTKVALYNNEFYSSGLLRIVDNSDALRRVLGMVRIVAPTNATVLINGETGTGKKLIAEAIDKSNDASNSRLLK